MAAALPARQGCMKGNIIVKVQPPTIITGDPSGISTCGLRESIDILKNREDECRALSDPVHPSRAGTCMGT